MESIPADTRAIVLITGANCGIGFATARALWNSTKPYHILASGRTLSKVQDAANNIRKTPSQGNSTIEEIELDISDDASIAKAAEFIQEKYNHIDALINNAGGSFDTEYQTGELSQREAWNRSMDLNVSSPQVVTTEFAPLLIRSTSPRLLFVTSGMSSLQEEREKQTPGEARAPKYPPGWPKEGRMASSNAYAYRVSKTALNMALLHWVRLLEADGVKCFGISPGFLATNLAGDPEAMKKAGAADPALGGEFIKDVVEGFRDEQAGSIVRRGGNVQPW